METLAVPRASVQRDVLIACYFCVNSSITSISWVFSGLNHHATILSHMFYLLENGKVVAPLYDAATSPGVSNNQVHNAIASASLFPGVNLL